VQQPFCSAAVVDKAALKLHMDAVLAARLGYARQKWWSFATPFTARWIKGKNLKKGIKWTSPETDNVNWGATIDPDVIRAEFAGKLFYGRLPDGRMSNGISLRNQNVGIFTGIDWSRIIDLETDTEEHGTGVNGEASKKAWEAINGPWPETRSFISPSGSIHRIYNHPGEGIFIKSFDGTSAFGKGVDCKADGGYMFLAPPSYRPPEPAHDGKPAKAGGFYRWDHKGEYYPTADLTPAMRAVLIRKPEPIIEKPPNPFLDIEQDSSGSRSWAEAALNNEAAAVANKKQPGRNSQLHKSACNLGEIVGGGALSEQEVIDALMAAATENGSVGEDGDKACRNTIASGLRKGKLKPRYAPPRIIDTLVYIEPTAPAANFDDLEAARRHFRAQVRNRLDPILNPFTDTDGEVGTPTDRHCASAHRIDTGVGKTSITVEEIARSDKTFVYAVPTLDLADHVARLFGALGVIAAVWRGRTADDPGNPGEDMCLNPDAVALAVKVMADVTTTCCKHDNFKCDFFEQCGYQKQIALLKQLEPRVVVVAADILFHEITAIGTPDFVVLDEGFWPKQLRGIDDGDRVFMSFDRMRKHDHGKLADSLSQQPEIGGLQRQYSFGYYDLTKLLIEQYDKVKAGIGLRPGMSRLEIAQLDKEQIGAANYSRQMIRLLKELRRMHRDWDMDQPSGRLLIEDNEGTRGIRWRGVAKITKQFRRETLILDATLPDIEVLKITHPLVDIDSDIRVALPESVSITQVLSSPTSKRKLDGDDRTVERHRRSVRRYILRRWMQLGKGRTLVICQKPVEGWMREHLPDEIELAHFNAIAGMDIYRDVRLLIVVGRPQPGPQGVEAQAATLTGAMPAQMVAVPTAAKTFNWFGQVQRGIRLRDGSGVAVQGDQHPDDFCEAIRWQICEAELVQAIGRARAIWRTDKTPLDIDLLFNTVVPIAVGEVLPWADPSLLIETAVEGVMLTSPVDLVKLWPGLWSNEKAAYRTVKDGVPNLSSFERVTYQLDGQRMNKRTGYFDRNLIPDPLAWLAARLGPLAAV
jgi:hypothetical protein